MPIRLLVQKQASAPYILMSIIAKALQCTHSILKRNKRKISVLSNKRVEDSALKVQALKVQRYVKLA